MSDGDFNYKDYLFSHVPREVPEFSGMIELGRLGEIMDSEDDDKAFQLLTAIIAAEEGANIIKDAVLRSSMFFSDPVVSPTQAPAPTDGASIQRERVWINKSFYLSEDEDRTVENGRQVFAQQGVGKIDEAFVIAADSSIGIQVIVDDEYIYSDNYTGLTNYSQEDSHLGAYTKPDTSYYVIRVNDISFQKNFVLIVTCTGEVTLEDIRINYKLLQEV